MTDDRFAVPPKLDPSGYHPRLIEAAAALNANELSRAEPLLRQHLKADPFDVYAIRMLAELAGRIGRLRDAETLLRRALEIAPGFTAARSNLALLLHRQNREAEALNELDLVSREEPDDPSHATLRAAVAGRIGEFDEALALYEDILSREHSPAPIWLSYGHTLKTVGRLDDGIAAYRTAIAKRPGFGEAWWSIANLKTARMDAADRAAIETALGDQGISADDRYHLHFALAKSLEDSGQAAAAFDHYLEANRLRRCELPYDAADTARAVDRIIELFTPEFVARRKGQGCQAPDPVFIVGMPRAGSTLVEQILSSHSMVEGTMELPDIPGIVNRLAREGAYPRLLDSLAPAQLSALGESYLATTRIQRREGKPLFIDKLPNNWMHAGLIHLILPNARIIDARRHPLDCGYSNFRQHFARGQAFSYDLGDIGHYYGDYVRLMAHFDRVLPGRIHRVIHERLLDDPEQEIGLLLSALNLPFERACIDFASNRRPVRTPSSEQVRQPINRSGEGRWRNIDHQLDPLKIALGDVLRCYPDVPDAWQAGNA
ncbi:tetratricopeptide repeat-containing sulfotransferase family protein [Novosphingobium sp.]|uniref:tetratricopeptide repeat-containing sulfotransferase family protein n=1 Tax=Novosphingobium sp. TaxID=1874826 RepID=UPI0025F1E83D|nr:tetratricopeptide repeat-containing sulfotransferase family protein [Novosphingobium sp.]